MQVFFCLFAAPSCGTEPWIVVTPTTAAGVFVLHDARKAITSTDASAAATSGSV